MYDVQQNYHNATKSCKEFYKNKKKDIIFLLSKGPCVIFYKRHYINIEYVKMIQIFIILFSIILRLLKFGLKYHQPQKVSVIIQQYWCNASCPAGFKAQGVFPTIFFIVRTNELTIAGVLERNERIRDKETSCRWCLACYFQFCLLQFLFAQADIYSLNMVSCTMSMNYCWECQ